VAYENGGIFTKYPAGEVVMVSRPTFSLDTVTTIPAIYLDGVSDISGEGIIRINSIHSTDSSPLKYIPTVDGNVSLVIISNYYKGWAEYLNETKATFVEFDHPNMSVSYNITSNFVNVDSDRILIKMES